VAEVLAGGPAEKGGVNAGDLLVAVDGIRATEELVARLEKERKPGTAVDVSVFRRDALRTHRVRLGGRRASVWKIEALAASPSGARRLKARWLGALSA
jgi:predicted metalloprotease with PDZ domain